MTADPRAIAVLCDDDTPEGHARWARWCALARRPVLDEDGHTAVSRTLQSRLHPAGDNAGSVVGVDTTRHRQWTYAQRAGDTGNQSED